jgi:hypothetical protein
LNKDTISAKGILLGIGLAWIIPTILFEVFGVVSEKFNWLWLGFPGMLFLAYGGLTQFVYMMPLIYWFRKKGHLGLVRGLWIGVITIIIGNICAVILFNRIEERARQGISKGNISKYQSSTPVYSTPSETGKNNGQTRKPD